MLSNKSWGNKEEGGDVQSNSICLPKSPLRVMEPCSPGDGCLPTGSGEGTHFVLLVQAAFDVPIKLSLSHPPSFHTFTLTILLPPAPPAPTRGE